MRSNAGLTTTALADYYEFTLDRGFLNATLVKFLEGVADFYASYGRRSSTPGNGTMIELPLTCAQEMCQQRLGGQTVTEDNALTDLTYARFAVAKLRRWVV